MIKLYIPSTSVMEKKDYLSNPCKASSLPFWKTNLVKIPENMKIVLEDDL